MLKKDKRIGMAEFNSVEVFQQDSPNLNTHCANKTSPITNFILGHTVNLLQINLIPHIDLLQHRALLTVSK